MPPARVLGHDVGEELHRDGVEAGEGLVEDEQLGPVHHRGRELDALRHSSRKAGDLVALAIGEIEFAKELAGAAQAVFVRQTVKSRDPYEEIADPHVAVEPTFLRHVSPAAVIGIRHRAPAPGEHARVGLQHTEDDPHERRLAGPVRAEQADDTTGGNLEVDLVEHDLGPEALRDGARGKHAVHSFAIPAGGSRQTGPDRRVSAATRAWQAVEGSPSGGHR